MTYSPHRTTRARRANPEHKLQVSVREFLVWCLPPSVEWTANAAGVHVSPQTANKMKAAGVRRGWPDLQFLFPDGVTRYIELKAGASLSPEQREFRDRCAPHRIFALCRSVDEVADTLRAWGVKLRAHPFNTNPEIESLALDHR
jgi:hypothetical protein